MRALLLLCCLLAALPARAEVAVRDDDGRTVTLARPAQRIVSLAPHITELLFAAGAGGHIVAAGAYSDYPEAAKRIPRVSDSFEIDIERIVAMRPDVIVVWRNGTPARQLEQLRRLGIPLYYSEPKKLDDIVDSIRRFGRLTGRDVQAQQAAGALERQLADLRARHGKAAPVTMLYQVLDAQIFTLGGGHIVSDAMRACGARNAFADIRVAAASVTLEAVLQRNPEVIVSVADVADTKSSVDWKAFPALAATRQGNLYKVDGDLFSRPGPRLIAGTAVLCEKIDEARRKRKP